MLSSQVHARSIDEASDEAIALAAIDAPEQFGVLYDRYVDRVFRYCALRLGDSDAAQDATSQVFTKALAGRSGFTGGLFAAWLFRIAHNVVVDVQRMSRPVYHLDLAATVADPGASPEATAVQNDEAHELRQLLLQLSTDQRRVIELRLAGFNGNQIASMLDMRRNTVDVTARRAILKLRELMIGDDDWRGR